MPNNAMWLREKKWGAFCHYLSPAELTIEQWNERVDSFDTDKLAQQLASAKVPYFFITIGQNSGHYCSCNETYTKLVGSEFSKCSKRDLVGDIIKSLKPYDIKLMVYLPSHAPAFDRNAVEKLKCTPAWDASQWGLCPGSYINHDGVDTKLSEFQRNWENIIGEWSQRWGSDVCGWWFDGCYYADKMYRDSEEPNFKSFAAATRRGNPKSIVAFNPGVFTLVRSMTEYEDYTAGEISCALPYDNEPFVQDAMRIKDGTVSGKQYHLLTYMGDWWGNGSPRFDADFVIAYTRHINSLGGALTWDVPISPTGQINPECLAVLTRLGESVNQ